ncbi:MAG: Asp-tRNA(Asn)/Glu-tRNA(Gln) amidotransferase subunit GatC [Simkania sp.]|nr:Asp-tRNA(Asn)/Glu-tRNA(Gln) amidotransferase subunit GatC [Simkania sp.]
MEHDLSEEDIEKLSHLCRIACTPEEKEKLRANLSKILGYVDQLKEIDTTGVPPCNSVLEGMTNPLREDESCDTMSREVFLANAPAHVGGMIRVPPVIKF